MLPDFLHCQGIMTFQSTKCNLGNANSAAQSAWSHSLFAASSCYAFVVVSSGGKAFVLHRVWSPPFERCLHGLCVCMQQWCTVIFRQLGTSRMYKKSRPVLCIVRSLLTTSAQPVSSVCTMLRSSWAHAVLQCDNTLTQNAVVS